MEKDVFDMNKEEYAEWFKEQNGYTLDEQLECNEAFEKDLRSLSSKMSDLDYAKDVYRALCNMRWKKLGSKALYSCSWRYAGGMVAEIRSVNEDYLNFYCSNNEGTVTTEVEKDMAELEWLPVPWDNDF